MIIPRRFHGPDESGNGGWSAGALAAELLAATGAPAASTVEVTLRRPPPLDRELPVVRDEDVARLLDDLADDAVVAEARLRQDGDAGSDLPTLPAVAYAEAAAAEGLFRGLADHPFTGCFACGPDRAPGDGLRIFPGSVPGADDAGVEHLVAATWTPAEDVDLPTTWAALDCSGGWAGDIGAGRLMVLGRITAQVLRVPDPGERLVVTGGLHGVEGRKTATSATLRDEAGAILGRAAHTWIAIS